MKITIIGTGYVGLVTGACLAHMGNDVTCVDIDEEKISKLRKGIIPIFELGLYKIVEQSLNQKTLSFSIDLKESIIESDVIFIAVGTPANKDGSSNLDYVFKVAQDIGEYIDSYKVF